MHGVKVATLHSLETPWSFPQGLIHLCATPIAALQVRLPLRLRVWRAHGRVARAAGSTPSAAGPGNPSLSGPQSGGPWLSSVLSGEAQVDLSTLVSAAAVRRHQPNTR